MTAACFIAWALLRPLGRELEDDEASEDGGGFEGERFSRETEAGAQTPVREPAT